jgi:hypothetical protein
MANWINELATLLVEYKSVSRFRQFTFVIFVVNLPLPYFPIGDNFATHRGASPSLHKVKFAVGLEGTFTVFRYNSFRITIYAEAC